MTLPISVALLGPDLPQAACKGRGNLWDDWADTPTGRENDTQRAQRHHKAHEICASCPERAACLQARLDDPDLGAGIYGGQLFERRHDRRCPCGQPLPDDAPKQRRYCTDRCKQQHNTTTPTYNKTCDNCANPFTTRQPQQRFCTTWCRDRHRGANTKPPTRTRLPGLANCQICGAAISPQQQSLGRRNCSLAHRKLAARRGLQATDSRRAA